MPSYTTIAVLCALCAFCGPMVSARRSLLQSSFARPFPNYQCNTDPSVSPFKLENTYTTSPSANGVRICFVGAPVQPCPPTNPCCSGPTADFYKLELRVRPTCSRAIRSVTVNGLPAPVPTFEVYGPARDLALFKLPKLNLTTANVTGAKICITLRDPCPNLAALCPEGDGTCTYSIGQSKKHNCCPVNKLGVPDQPPVVPTSPPPLRPASPVPTPVAKPQPPPPAVSSPTPSTSRRPPPYTGTFPYDTTTCNQTTGLMPFTLAGAPALSRSLAGQNLYCFTLSASACSDPASSCCSSSLLKVDWWSFDTCRGSVKAYIDKVNYPVTWDQGGTFRLTKLNYTRADIAAKPKQLCIELRRDGPCDTIDKFCRGGRCTYALYDTARDCCPTSSTPLSR